MSSINQLDASRLSAYETADGRTSRPTDRVAEVLREAILDGALPPGSWLRERELASELSVSRTPIREALRRLEAEGLVVITANQGAEVAPITSDDILQTYVVRETLEGIAAQLTAQRRPPKCIVRLRELLVDMERALDEGDLSEIAKLNIEFHKAIRQGSGNRYVDRFLTQIEHSVRRFGQTTYQIPGRAAETIEEHRGMVDAISDKDGPKAKRLAIEHMHKARDLRIRMLVEGWGWPE